METTDKMEENEKNDVTEINEKSDKKVGKILIAVIVGLLVVTAIAAVWYLSHRDKTPENALTVVSGGKEQVKDIDAFDLETFSGTVVNGKEDKKDIESQGVKLGDVIGTSDFSEVTVTSDDAYSVVVKKDEIDQAWLEIEEGKARLYVFGDENSKRNVKNVVRVEVK